MLGITKWSKLEDMPGEKCIVCKTKEHKEDEDTVAVKRDKK